MVRLLSTVFLLVVSVVVFSTILYINTNSSYELVFATHPEHLLTPPDLSTINSGNPPSADIFNMPSGYKIEPVRWGLTLPSSLTLDDEGNTYIAESGYIYGEFKPIPRILKVDGNGNTTVFLDRMLNAPITDIEYYKGKIYVSHRGAISSIDKNGVMSDVIVGLSSMGDHHNNQIAFGKDGRLYFGQGVKTNTGVVGEDNAFHGWLKTVPREHDIPCQDITLTGQNFTSANPLTPHDMDDTVTTGAFMPLGNTALEGQKVKGDIKCNGAILSANPDGSDIKLEAWGLRNPFGLAFNSEGRLFATDNGADERGSRPIANDNDKFHEINLNETAFFGWPDYFGNAEPVTDSKFKSQTGDQSLQFLMANHPPVEKPLSLIDKYAGVTQFDFSTNNNFGYEGMAFAGEIGIMAPITHPLTTENIIDQLAPSQLKDQQEIVGQKVIVLDPTNGNHSNFVSLKNPDANFRPVGIEFDERDNGALYIISIGKIELRNELPNGTPLPLPLAWAYPYTGAIWKVTSS